MTKREVAEIFGVFLLAYPKAEMFKGGAGRLEPTIALWARALGGVDFFIGQKAAAEIIKTCVFPPTIAEFSAAAKRERDKEENGANQQWLEVLDALRYWTPGDKTALLSARARAAVKSCGGMGALRKLGGADAYHAFVSKYREMSRGERLAALGQAVKQMRIGGAAGEGEAGEN